MEGEREDAVRALVLEIQGRGSSESRKERVAGERSRCLVDEELRQLEGLRAGLAVEPEHEVRLDVRDVSQDRVDMLRNLVDLVDALRPARPRFVAEVVPRLDAGQERRESVPLHPDEMRLGEDREAAFRDEVDAIR